MEIFCCIGLRIKKRDRVNSYYNTNNGYYINKIMVIILMIVICI